MLQLQAAAGLHCGRTELSPGLGAGVLVLGSCCAAPSHVPPGEVGPPHSSAAPARPHSAVMGWRGEEGARRGCPPPACCKPPVFCPSGFCLTNGVSFLQRYDPGLVVVMVNLAVVIFNFQTELLLLSSVHQYVRLTFSVVAIILLLGLSFSFPFFMHTCLILVHSRVLLRRDVSVCVRTAKISLNVNF